MRSVAAWREKFFLLSLTALLPSFCCCQVGLPSSHSTSLFPLPLSLSLCHVCACHPVSLSLSLTTLPSLSDIGHGFGFCCLCWNNTAAHTPTAVYLHLQVGCSGLWWWCVHARHYYCPMTSILFCLCVMSSGIEHCGLPGCGFWWARGAHTCALRCLLHCAERFAFSLLLVACSVIHSGRFATRYYPVNATPFPLYRTAARTAAA